MVRAVATAPDIAEEKENERGRETERACSMRTGCRLKPMKSPSNFTSQFLLVILRIRARTSRVWTCNRCTSDGVYRKRWKISPYRTTNTEKVIESLNLHVSLSFFLPISLPLSLSRPHILTRATHTHTPISEICIYIHQHNLLRNSAYKLTYKKEEVY